MTDEMRLQLLEEPFTRPQAHWTPEEVKRVADLQQTLLDIEKRRMDRVGKPA